MAETIEGIIQKIKNAEARIREIIGGKDEEISRRVIVQIDY